MLAEELVKALEPWMTPDLEDYLTALGSMFAEVEFYSEDQEGVEDSGWSVLLDVKNVPVEALPYLAQFVGERLPVGIAEADAREWVEDAPNQRRGTLESIVRVAQRHLTGDRTVGVTERSGDPDEDYPEDYLTIVTYEDETPNPDLVLRDLLADAVPADIVLTYLNLEGQTWGAVNAEFDTWAEVAGHYATWEDVRTDQAGYTIYTRPRVTS